MFDLTRIAALALAALIAFAPAVAASDIQTGQSFQLADIPPPAPDQPPPQPAPAPPEAPPAPEAFTAPPASSGGMGMGTMLGAGAVVIFLIIGAAMWFIRA